MVVKSVCWSSPRIRPLLANLVIYVLNILLCRFLQVTIVLNSRNQCGFVKSHTPINNFVIKFTWKKYMDCINITGNKAVPGINKSIFLNQARMPGFLKSLSMRGCMRASCVCVCVCVCVCMRVRVRPRGHK